MARPRRSRRGDGLRRPDSCPTAPHLEPVRGITVCVGFDDLLQITLPRNMRHLTECLVVTAPHDTRTQEFCRSLPSVRLHITDAFYQQGARFNKGAALEEGFDALGREGWILVWDADTLFPDNLPLPFEYDRLYCARRRILDDPGQWSPEYDWNQAWVSHEHGFPGYFHLFHATDVHIAALPWYDTTFNHAGGCDTYFERRWTDDRKVWLPFDVLHLGPRDTHWFGRGTPRLDQVEVPTMAEARQLMQRFRAAKGWGTRRSGERFDERVQQDH